MNDIFQLRNGELFLPAADLYLDAKKKKSFGYISHAHGDHSANHHSILCTPQTARLAAIRLKNPNCQMIPFFRKIKYNQVSVTLLPAGHIRGSAQLYCESSSGRFLYTGDFRTRPSRTAESFIYQSCDVLIMETTYGNPRYCFPPRREVEEAILGLVRQKLNQGITPVVFAYPLGKAQEALHLLSHAKIPVAVDYSILRFVRVYEKLGVKFGSYEKFRRSDHRDKILLLPVMYRRSNYIEKLPDKYTIFLSGWGMDPSAPARFGVDDVFPYSDHADFEELLSFVDRVSPDRIYCTHGINDFVGILREKGYNSQLLLEPDQRSLFH
jgi:Cft2 family RNA processing exonuclease